MMYDEEQRDLRWNILRADEEEARSQRRHFIDAVRQDADRPDRDESRQ